MLNVSYAEDDRDASENNGVERTVAALVDNINKCAAETGEAASTAQSVALNVRMVSGMMSELSRSIDVVIADAKRTHDQSDRVTEESNRTGERLESLMNQLANVSLSAEQIRGVALHTNLLALNASIEAARAGEHGRGFAVIAREIRSLAEQTTATTKSIDLQLSAIRTAAEELGRSIASLKESFAEERTLVDGISDAMRQQKESFSAVSGFTDEAAGSAEGISATLERAVATEQRLTDDIAALNTLLVDGQYM